MSLRTALPLFALTLSIITTACGSSDSGTAPPADTGTKPADAGTDTKKPDTGAPDTGSGVACEEALATDFKCAEPAKGTAGTSCTEAMLQEFIKVCINAGLTEPSTCAAWKTANAACATCVASWSWSELPGKVYPDDYKCYWANMDADCAKSVNCSYDCQEATCGGCDDTEKNDCLDSVTSSGGKCWSVAAEKAEACLTKYDISMCNVDELYASSPSIGTLQTQVLEFFRGACRDNGSWSASTSAGDAGTSTDGGASDSGVADAASGG